MKIINWLFGVNSQTGYTPIPQDEKIDEYEIIENDTRNHNPLYNRYNDIVSIDAIVYRCNNPTRIPVIILVDLQIKELRRTLFGLEKNMTVRQMNNRITTENNMSRTRFYYYYYDEPKNKKILLLATTTIEELDLKYRAKNGFLYLSMGS